MKRLFFLAMLLLSLNSYSQKVDIDNYRFYVEYAELPLHKVDAADRTFTVQVSGGADTDLGSIADELFIRGWTYQEEGNVTSRTSYYTASSSNIGRATVGVSGPSNKYKAPLTERGKKRKAKKDKKKNAKKKEAAAEKASNPFLKDVDIKTEEDEASVAGRVAFYDLGKNYAVSGGEKRSRTAALKSFNATKGSSYSNNKTDFYDNLSGRVSSKLNALYGYSRTRDYVKFKRLDSKKHPEFEMFENATTAMKAILGKKRFNKKHDEVNEAIAPIIEYFKDVTKRYGQDKKHPKRLKSAAMYNLAQIYLYMDMPDEAIAIGKEYERWDYDKKTGKRFVKKGEALKHWLDFHGTPRYFVTDEDADKIKSEDKEEEEGN